MTDPICSRDRGARVKSGSDDRPEKVQASSLSLDDAAYRESGVSQEKPSAQVALAAKAGALKAEKAKPALSAALIAANKAHITEAALAADDAAHQRHDQQNVHGARAPPAVRLLGKAEVCAIANVTFPTIWAWMRAGTFPRSRAVGGKSMWRPDEIDAWLGNLPKRVLKGDAEVEVA
jgi:predicted DNA-binding transcriptional regulator AlpA